jgi:hypothetical protein
MNHKVFVPPRAPEPEPTAQLTYNGETFEIGYTLMHYLSGWVRMGAHQSNVNPGVIRNANAMFEHIASCMCWDANPPPEDEHTEMLRRCGHKVQRPTFELPCPELVVPLTDLTT